jgi:hypothetical protein
MYESIPSVPYWQPALGGLGQCVTGLEELAQAIRIIVSTPLGSLPHRPDFGCDLTRFVDMPQTIARALIIREVSEAIAHWEPRVKVSSVGVAISEFGVSTLTVAWAPAGSAPGASEQITQAVVATSTTGEDYIPASLIGVPGGVAPLSASGTVPEVFLPVQAPGSGSSSGGEIPTAIDGGEIV